MSKTNKNNELLINAKKKSIGNKFKPIIDIKCDSKIETNSKIVDSKSKKIMKNAIKNSEVIVFSEEIPNILSQSLQSFDQKMAESHKTVPLSKTVNCQICCQTFDSKSILCEHLKTSDTPSESREESLPFPDLVESFSNSKGRIKCGKCDFRTDSEAEMILHSINHSVVAEESKRLRCPTCNQCFSKLLLRKHVFIHTSEKPFKCEICKKEFTSRQSLLSHESRHFPQNQVLKCQFCSVSFATERGYKKHTKTHESDREKSHSCDVCDASFFDKESLKAHTIRIHLPKNARRFKCEFEGCRYMTLYHHQLLEHQRTHSDDKPFSCDLCQYSAKSKWSFKKHYRTHTKEKPFKCQVCDYSSSLCSNLTRHMRIHTGSKPFKCPYCSYSCNNHENLRKHVLKSKKHQGLHLYNCKHCIFSTNSFSELRQHLELNHNDIYSVEQIDRMISSFYHKSEDTVASIQMEPNKYHSFTEKSIRKCDQKLIKPNECSQTQTIHSQQSNEIIIPIVIHSENELF